MPDDRAVENISLPRAQAVASKAETADADLHPLDAVVEEFSERCRRGEAVSIEEYVRQHPRFADELRGLLSSIALMEKLKAQAGSAQSGKSRPAKPPQQLGDFRIIREVGRGGMGVVYEAFEQSLGRHVALKILSTPALIDPRQLQRFQREAQAAGRLHHTNIVPVFGAGHVDAIHFYVMQYIDGEALNHVLARLSDGPVHPSSSKGIKAAPASTDVPRGSGYWQWVAHVGQQVAGALDYAHQQGTLHRDVKPANLLLDGRGTTWITDFGLAKLQGPVDVTQSGDVIGTLQYLAPESLHGKADARSDIYSLGLTLYEMLTLHAPIQGDTPAATLRAIAELTPAAPSRLVAGVPRDLETIVLKTIAREPAARYQTAMALAEDLENFLHDRPIAARRTTALERLWRWSRRNRPLAAASAAAVLAILLAMIVGWIGYANTRTALAAEAMRRHEADLATARAEHNVQLSLAAFEKIFNQVDQQQSIAAEPPPPDRPGAAAPTTRGSAGNGIEPIDRGPGGHSDAADAGILASILSFYDGFARDNSTNQTLQSQAARAYQRIGDLYFRMGNQTPAMLQAYERAASMYRELREVHADRSTATLLGWADAVSSIPPRADDAAQLAAQVDVLVKLTELLSAVSPATGASNHRRAAALTRLADVFVAQKSLGPAKGFYEEALSLWRDQPPMPPPGPPIATPQALDATLGLAALLAKENQLRDARLVLRGALYGNDDRRGNPPPQGPPAQTPPTPPGQREKMALVADALASVDKQLSMTGEAQQATRDAARLRARPRGGPEQGRQPAPPPPRRDGEDEGPPQGFRPPRDDDGPPDDRGPAPPPRGNDFDRDRRPPPDRRDRGGE